MRMDELLAEAAAKGKTVEVNGIPDRLDLCADHVRTALRRGCKLVLSVDAHSTAGLSHLGLAAAVARRGWARRKDVLNTRPLPEFLAALRAP
jgi:DNA polymerase (family 10)